MGILVACTMGGGLEHFPAKGKPIALENAPETTG
jgi:hypothetical protein